MMTRTSRRARRAARLAAAFSLIEVLIAILILALGLLGLGAVIPVVVREQRVAAEGTRAVIAANNARAYLQARPDLNRLIGDSGGIRGGGLSGGSRIEPMGFGVWLEDTASWSKDHLWAAPRDLWDTSYRGTGDLRQAGRGAGATIPLVDRLWPDPSSGAEPVLVWDFVARRVAAPGSSGSPAPDMIERTLEVAVFIRRLDPAIRVPPGRTRLQVLTDQSLPASMRRLAIASDPSRGPTGDGTGEYSLPIAIEAAIAPGGRRDRVRLDPNGRVDQWVRDAAARPGQKFVDNIGNVYTVLRREAGSTNIDVLVTPAVPTTAQGAQFQQVAFTPQIPAAVEVFRITIPEKPVKSPNGSGAGAAPWFGRVGQQP